MNFKQTLDVRAGIRREEGANLPTAPPPEFLHRLFNTEPVLPFQTTTDALLRPSISGLSNDKGHPFVILRASHGAVVTRVRPLSSERAIPVLCLGNEVRANKKVTTLPIWL
jgi:hypothetical protein